MKALWSIQRCKIGLNSGIEEVGHTYAVLHKKAQDKAWADTRHMTGMLYRTAFTETSLLQDERQSMASPLTLL
mgnify:FL=1